MIVIFSSNDKGGIVQFSIEMTKQILALGYKAKLFLPSNAVYSKEGGIDSFIEKFNKKNALFFNSKNNKRIVERILDISPDIVLFSDNTIVTSQICLLVAGKIKTIITFHDGGLYHKTFCRNLKNVVHDKIENFYSVLAAKKASHLLLLSKYSLECFIKKNPKLSSKTILMNLGAHVPNVDPLIPKECTCQDYLLFFGRIDKYKGLEKFIETFNKSKLKISFVIAGNGLLQDSAREIIKNDKRIVFINRYISDPEMVSLFVNARACVLPYIEATQSGIIPIAYYYGKPVITSNIEGLTQFVVDNRTGCVCNCGDDYIESIKSLFFDENRYKEISSNCVEFYKSNLDAKSNLFNMLREIDANAVK